MENNFEEQNQKEEGKRLLKKILFFLFLIVVAIIIASFLFIKKTITTEIKGEQKNPNLSQELEKMEKYQAENKENENFWFGAEEAKITIVQFGDFNCPACGSSYHTIRKISLDQKENVKLIFRDFPVFEESLILALAARCAGEQDLFWNMYDKLYQNQGKFEANDQNMILLARQIGADIETFQTCLSSQKYLKNIQTDYQDALNLKIEGTPAWFINGYKFMGDIPAEIFNQIIDLLLEESSSN